MLERIITFVVIGVFVFSPAMPSWHSSSLPGWYDLYAPWLLLILLAIWIHARQSDRNF